MQKQCSDLFDSIWKISELGVLYIYMVYTYVHIYRMWDICMYYFAFKGIKRLCVYNLSSPFNCANSFPMGMNNKIEINLPSVNYEWARVSVKALIILPAFSLSSLFSSVMIENVF